MEVISIVAIIIFWQVHDLLVSTVELGVQDLNIPGTSFPTYKMGLHPEGFLRTKVDGAYLWHFTVSFLDQFLVFCSPRMTGPSLCFLNSRINPNILRMTQLLHYKARKYFIRYFMVDSSYRFSKNLQFESGRPVS